MKNRFLLFSISAIILLLFSYKAKSNDPIFYSVQLQADVKSKPAPSITLNWKAFTESGYIQILKRKSKDETTWKNLAVLDYNFRSYTDTNVKTGRGYEYCIVLSRGDTSIASGYIYSGIDLPLIENRGKALLLVDKTMAEPLEKELNRYIMDLKGDGWQVIRYDVPRSESFNPAAVENVKKKIRNEYNKDPQGLKALILFGRIPVPYSGDCDFDGHYNEHGGAWPADVYYSDFTGEWSDTIAFTITSIDLSSHNIPLDGKYDQTYLPGYSSLECGRIDMYDLPNFQQSETELLRRYLNKNHDFRHGLINIRKRALIDDKFEWVPEYPKFGACAWMNFSPLVGYGNIDSGKTLNQTLDKEEYIWSYAGNFGGTNSVLHSLYTSDLAVYPCKSVFMLLLGSRFPYWDETDDLLRAAIASSPSVLNAAFTGIPFLYYHHMGMGESIGYSMRISQNNADTYPSILDEQQQGVHIALMGDPTLRMFIVKPPENPFLDFFNITGNGKTIVKFSWKAPGDSVIGYYIYRARGMDSTFTRLNGYPVTDTSFTDENAFSDKDVYMIKALKLELTPSGTFYNLSQGVYFLYDSLIASAPPDDEALVSLDLSPNPANINSVITISADRLCRSELSVISADGRLVKNISSGWTEPGSHSFDWSLDNANGERVTAGVYFIRLKIEGRLMVKKLIVLP